MRFFVAGFPPAAATAHLHRYVERLRVWPTGARARMTAPERWHLTLAFLGELDPGRQPGIELALRDGLDAWRGGAAGAPPVQLAGGGRFGTGRSTVLWVGVVDESGELARLAGALRDALTRAGLPCDDRPFRGHLTLARPGDRLPDAALRADLRALADYQGPPWSVDPVELVASPPGPAYERRWAQPTAG